MDSKYNINDGIEKFLVTILAMGRFVYHKTPTSLRFIFLPAKLILKYLKSLRLGLWIIKGEENTSNQKLAIAYAGNEKNKNYIEKLAFGSSYKEKYLGKIWLWKLFKMIKENENSCSLMITEVYNVFRIFFKNQKCFYIPCWISGEVDISDDISSFTKRASVKTDMRKIRKNKLNFEVTNELSQLHNFYNNMYLPYITKVHGNEAIVAEYDFIKKKFRTCDLLLIKKGKEYIAGNLIDYTKNRVRVWYVGIKDGNTDYMKDGAIAALYYFSVHYLKEKGFKRVGFAESRAFLKDGVLQFKKKRGIQLVDTSETSILIKPLSRTPGIKGFFLNNPFIYMDKGRFNGAIFVESDQSFSEEDFKKIYSSYYLRGLSKLFIYRFEKSDSGTQEIVPSELNDRIIIRSAKDLF